MVTWSQSVFSKMAQTVAYEADKEELQITWNNGRVSAYSGVPEDVAYACANAASVGEYINSEIKPIYAHRYLA